MAVSKLTTIHALWDWKHFDISSIQNGNVLADRFPYLVSILDRSGMHRCSGVMYGTSNVLTDAACIRHLEAHPIVVINPGGNRDHQLYPKVKVPPDACQRVLQVAEF